MLVYLKCGCIFLDNNKFFSAIKELIVKIDSILVFIWHIYNYAAIIMCVLFYHHNLFTNFIVNNVRKQKICIECF